MGIKVLTLGQGKPLVLLHGWGFNHRIWLPLAEALQTKYSFYLVDLPGFGDSSLVSWTTFKEDILPQLPSHFTLLGWSLGGLYAMRLALEAPFNVTKLIVTAASPRFIEDLDWPGVSLSLFRRFFLQLKDSPKQVVEDFIALQSNNRYQLVNGLPSLDALEQGLEILSDWDLRGSLTRMTNPTTFIFGRLDRITPVAILKTMQLQYPNFDYYLFKKAAHMPFLSHQEEFIACLDGMV